jgi:hypothetical protein
MLNEESGGGLYDFLESAISHTLHQKRSLNTARYLSEMDLLNVEYALAKTKQASVRFTFTKKCRVCHKPIADKVHSRSRRYSWCFLTELFATKPALKKTRVLFVQLRVRISRRPSRIDICVKTFMTNTINRIS